MRKFKRKLMRRFILFVILIGLLFYGINVYFTRMDSMKSKLEKKVLQVERQQGVDHPLNSENIPSFYKKAVIATEDRRFSWDPGIDPIGILRSIQVDLSKRQFLQGGSTITQQLVDNTFLKRGNSIGYKLTQSVYAIGIYDTVPKSTVFTMYANVIYFGHGAYGLYNASMTYFNKTPGELNNGELALLAGIPNSPSNLDPLKHLDLAKERQRVVVQNMVEMGVVTQSEAAALLKEPLRLVSTDSSHSK